MSETCETSNGYETVMRKFDDGGASLGNESIPCPTCCLDCQPEYDIDALAAENADLRARAVPESTQYVAWESGANRLTVESWRGVWQWHTWRGDGPGCIASGLAGTMQAAIAAAEEEAE